MRKYDEHVTVIKVKEAYSILGQAFKMAQAEHGNFNTWDIGIKDSVEGARKVQKYFEPYLKVTNKTPNDIGREYSLGINSLDGLIGSTNISRTSSIQLQNGMNIFFWSGGWQNHALFGSGNIATIFVDVNGNKKPNQSGKDVFYFNAVNKNILFPVGIKEMFSDLKNKCNMNVSNGDNGKHCTAWVLYKGNMDYLRRQVSWDE